MKKEKFIYTVTLMEDLCHSSSPRTFGFFYKLEDAKTAIENNHGGMDECLYDYGVIEEFGEGIHFLCKKELWYKWNEKESKFKSIKKPERTNGTLNWAMG